MQTDEHILATEPEEVSALDRIYRRKPWYRSLSQRLGLQAKLVVAFIVVIMLTLGGFVLLSLRDTQDRMTGELSAQARQVSVTLAALGSESIVAGRTEQLKTVSSELIRSSSNITGVTFYNLQGEPIAWDSRSGSRPSNFDPRNTTTLGQVIKSFDSACELISITVPVFSSLDQRIVGFVRVSISLDQLTQQTHHVAWTAGRVGLALVMFSIPVAWLLVKRIFLPIRLLVQAASRIAAGDLDTRVETDRPDVIGDLARKFNDMSRTVKQQQHALKKANQQLAEANRDLESKVEQRTAQFEAANKRLSAEIAEKEDFLRAVSHDLNAPLRNISGMVTMLLMKKKDSLDEDAVHRLDRIKKNVEVETDLINELLELSRIKTRRQAMEQVNLEEMVWDLRGLFENDLKTRQIQLIVDTALPALHCERARVRQVFQNLIDNAIKYMGEGETREIHVGCTIRLSEAEFYVRDTGLGIDADDVGKVFFVFRRGKNTGAQNVSGKGVGLASVKSIIETYSGKIWVESEAGKGSTFRFTINGQYVPATGGERKGQTDHARGLAA
jgi:signal transduction histidine kinase